MDRTDFLKEEIERSIPARFELIANKYAERTAVKSANFEFTYDTLNKFANRVAQAIIGQFGTDENPIVLLCDHDAPIIAAILGVLKAGQVYVALDPLEPVARSSFILEDLQTKLIIADANNLTLARKLAHSMCQVLTIDEIKAASSDQNLDLLIPSDKLAGVFYTSGTSGQPKGVERNHRFILHRIWLEANDYHIGPNDNFSLIHSCGFGASLTDIFDALLNGAKLSLYDIKEAGIDPLSSWLKREEITFFHSPSALFRQFINLLTEKDFFPKMRQITPSGRLYKRDVMRIRKHIPTDCILIQRLASTETGMITRFKIDQNSVLTANVVPVGYPVEDKEILILDDAGRSLDFNCVGEIAVKSRYLASGYWRRPDLTQKAFLRDAEEPDKFVYRLGDLGRMRADGCLELFGRKDFQVKIRGYRVEPGEIEAALLNLEFIKEAAVIAQANQAGDKRLVAYVVPAGQTKLTASILRSALVKKLPDYMIPTAFVMLGKLPLTARNKLDRKALPDPGRTRPELEELFAAPQTSFEKTLAKIWSEVLNIEPVGVNDNFFELGGQSLLAALAVSRIRATFQVGLSLRTLFDSPTISALATAIENVKNNETPPLKENLDDALRMLGVT